MDGDPPGMRGCSYQSRLMVQNKNESKPSAKLIACSTSFILSGGREAMKDQTHPARPDVEHILQRVAVPFW